MCDEVLSKNFLEDKRTNQKNLFEKDPSESVHVKNGRSANIEELMESLTEQFKETDFVDEVQKAEAYEEYYVEDHQPDSLE